MSCFRCAPEAVIFRYDCVRGVGGLSAPACVHLAGHNLGILMRQLTGPEPDREATAHSLVPSALRLYRGRRRDHPRRPSGDRFAVLVMVLANDPACQTL